MIDKARQIAVDLARQPELLKRTSGRSEVAARPEDDKLAKVETSCSPEDAPETRRLPRAAQLPPVAGLPVVEAPTRNAISFESVGLWVSTPLLHRPREPFSSRMKLLIAIAVATQAAGYFILGNFDRPADVAVAPQATIDISPVEFLPSREGQLPAAASVSIGVENRVEPEVQTASLHPAPLDTKPTEKPTESGAEARPPPTVPEERSFGASKDASTCFASASAVRQNHPRAWPSWTLRAPGYEGTRCWYAATRTTTNDHRSGMRRKETVQTREAVQTTEKPEVPWLFGLQ
jgi:hypothetical protein